ncbi:MAG TPA: nuclease-related domain-containing protein [Solirubrobacteraceae bacterium]|nr:nuclease-related domain-containing protein [Solirubrobacteraceae bacterium]
MSIVNRHTVRMPRRRDPTTHMPGQHARATVLRLRMRTLVTLGVLAVVTTVLGRTFGLHSPLFIGSELALLLTMFAVSRYVLPLVDRHDRGAAGEEHVGALLEELTGSGWSVIHDASFGHGNVDHIVLGPAGLFTVETKSHPGPVRVRAIHGAVLRQAQDERETLERVTDERVEPLLVFSRAWVDKPLTRRHGVRVIPARMLLGYLSRRGPALPPEQLERARERIVAALAESGPSPDKLLGWPPPSRSRL